MRLSINDIGGEVAKQDERYVVKLIIEDGIA